MILYHYTCMFCAAQIRRDGRIRPMPQAALAGTPLVWLGDFRLRSPLIRQRLGLAQHSDSNRPCAAQQPPCEPTAVRFGVTVDIADHPYVHPFNQLARVFPDAAAMYRMLPGANPWRWWYSTAPIKILGGNRHV